MRQYSNIISLAKNARGIYSLDPTLGCTSGTSKNKRGCFGDCYAYRIATIYGYDFSKTVLREFKNNAHFLHIQRQYRAIEFPFIRMGTLGDPSEAWEHTLVICEMLQLGGQMQLFNKPKEIVIITKHWNVLNESQLNRLKQLNVCVNTSTSAIEKPETLHRQLEQYELLKHYCKSILRLVTFDFNTENEMGLFYNSIQSDLVKNYKILDTVFRPTKNNELLNAGIIKAQKSKFLGKNALLSKMNKKTYIGNCKNCLEMCGVNM